MESVTTATGMPGTLADVGGRRAAGRPVRPPRLSAGGGDRADIVGAQRASPGRRRGAARSSGSWRSEPRLRSTRVVPAEQVTDALPGRAAVGGDHDGAAGGRVGRVLEGRRRRRLPRSSRVSMPRPGPGRRPASGRTRRGTARRARCRCEPLPLAEVPLPQPGVGADRQAGQRGERGGGVARPGAGRWRRWRPGAARRAAARRRRACSRPSSLSGTSVWPWTRLAAFQSVLPCRQMIRRVIPRRRRRRRLGVDQVAVDERDLRAVLPEPVERVELALLGVLDVHHDVDVVEQHPAATPLALAAHRLGLLGQLEQALLDGVDDGQHLALVGRGGDQERVGDRELVAHVDDDDVLAPSCRPRPGRRPSPAR